MKTKHLKYQQLRNAGTFTGTIKRAVALRDARDELAAGIDPLTIPMARRWLSAKTLIPLGAEQSQIAADHARADNPRKSNFVAPAATLGASGLRTNDLGRYSGRCRYTHNTYTPAVQSFAVACGASLWFTLDGKRKRISAPFGYRWSRDKNGVKLVSRSNPYRDYHPTADDLLGNVRDIVGKLKANHETRRLANANKKQQLAAVKRAEREGATVCLRDSIRAGNCVAGTSNFCQRHGLDSRRHYKPSEVLAVANGDASRVALVVTVALKRHREEMRRGFAILAEHQA